MKHFEIIEVKNPGPLKGLYIREAGELEHLLHLNPFAFETESEAFACAGLITEYLNEVGRLMEAEQNSSDAAFSKVETNDPNP